jgi:basic membrane protein A and related proteins
VRKNRMLWLVMLLVAAALSVVAAGCGGDDEEGGADTAGAGDTSTEGTGAGGEAVRACLVTDIGGLNDRGFNSLANEALERAATELGVETRVLESKSDADYIPNLSECATQGFDIIVSNGFLMGDATEAAAKQFPDATFAIIDFAYEAPAPNLQGLVFKEQEVGYLVGYLAALVTESNTVSSVGGQKIPPVDRFIAGYQKAVADANPDATALNGYSQDFVDQAKCKEVALDQIAKGSDVVFQVAGGCGLGALDAAKEKGVWGIGVDKDQAFLGDHILTSAVKKVDQAVFQTIEMMVNGEQVGGGTTVFGLAEEAVALGEVSPDIDQSIVDQVEEQTQKIIDGEIEIPEEVK